MRELRRRLPLVRGLWDRFGGPAVDWLEEDHLRWLEVNHAV
jgi:hypothetical protein